MSDTERELKEIIVDLAHRCERAEAALAVAREALEEARQALMAASMSGSTTIPVRQAVDAAFDRVNAALQDEAKR